MKYASGEEILAGDVVLVEDDCPGVVVCDFEGGGRAPGYESGWEADVEYSPGERLNRGVMVKSTKYGLIYYREPDDDIVFVSRPGQ